MHRRGAKVRQRPLWSDELWEVSSSQTHDDLEPKRFRADEQCFHILCDIYVARLTAGCEGVLRVLIVVVERPTASAGIRDFKNVNRLLDRGRCIDAADRRGRRGAREKYVTAVLDLHHNRSGG